MKQATNVIYSSLFKKATKIIFIKYRFLYVYTSLKPSSMNKFDPRDSLSRE